MNYREVRLFQVRFAVLVLIDSSRLFSALVYNPDAFNIAVYTMDGLVYSINVETLAITDVGESIRKLLQPDITQEAVANEGEDGGDVEEEPVTTESSNLRLNIFGATNSPNNLVHTLVYRYSIVIAVTLTQ